VEDLIRIARLLGNNGNLDSRLVKLIQVGIYSLGRTRHLCYFEFAILMVIRLTLDNQPIWKNPAHELLRLQLLYLKKIDFSPDLKIIRIFLVLWFISIVYGKQ
jgi:hypothetical protein